MGVSGREGGAVWSWLFNDKKDCQKSSGKSGSLQLLSSWELEGLIFFLFLLLLSLSLSLSDTTREEELYRTIYVISPAWLASAGGMLA